jgi:hypothetical protein
MQVLIVCMQKASVEEEMEMLEQVKGAVAQFAQSHVLVYTTDSPSSREVGGCDISTLSLVVNESGMMMHPYAAGLWQHCFLNQPAYERVLNAVHVAGLHTNSKAFALSGIVGKVCHQVLHL